MTSELPKVSVAETLAAKIAGLKPGVLPASTTQKCTHNAIARRCERLRVL